MFYVAEPGKPYPNDKLHHGDLFEMTEWAQNVAARDGRPLDVRQASSQKLVACFDRAGQPIPIRGA